MKIPAADPQPWPLRRDLVAESPATSTSGLLAHRLLPTTPSINFTPPVAECSHLITLLQQVFPAMSYSYERVETRRRRAAAASGGGYGTSNRRTTLGYWLPLAFTVTVATIGLAAWVWSERKDDDESDSDYPQPRSGYPGGIPPPGYGPPPSNVDGVPPMGAQRPGSEMGGGFGGEASYSRSTERVEEDQNTFIGKMSGAWQRSPSPQKFFDSASKTVAAGVAAAGAMVGGALGSIREEDKGNFEDHTRWSEEAEDRENDKAPSKAGIKRRGTSEEFYSGAVSLPKGTSLKNRKRRTVAVVVSSVTSGDAWGDHGGFQDQHAVRDLFPAILQCANSFSSLSSHSFPSMWIPTRLVFSF